MKKLSLIFIMCFCLFLTACGSDKEKEVKDLSDFTVASSNLGFTVTSNMDNYADIDYIKDAMVATKDATTLEMVIYDNSENAKKAQDNQIETFKKLKGSGANTNSDKGKNYYKYTMITNGFYMISSRVDNTLVFSRIPVDNKDSVDSIIDELGY